MDKVSFNDAARTAGIHLNTLRNWQKAGKLKTSEKVLENGREVWIIDPSEVTNLSSQHGKRPDTNNVDTIDTNNPPPPQFQAEPTTTPAFDQSLALIRESVVRPLTELVERQSNRIEELSLEVGELRAELRLMKEAREQLEAAQTVSQPPQPVEHAQPASRDPETHNPPEPPKKRRWWQF